MSLYNTEQGSIKDTILKKVADEYRESLQEFYGEPVKPMSNFCDAITTWFRCIENANTDPELKKHCHQGSDYYRHLRHIEIDIRKSNLLARLLYSNEKFRTKMCPEHKGSLHLGFYDKPCPYNCDYTGWIREE